VTLPSPPTGPDDVGTPEDFDPAWAPGGRHVVYREADGSVVVLGADDTKRVIATGAAVDGPAWSPNGRLIAFSRCNASGAGCAIWLVRPNGTHLRRLTNGTMNEQAPSWSPNGRRLVFEADGGLWTIRRRAFGHRPRPRRLLDSGRGPSWSPDGTQIAFGRPDGVYVVNADGSDARLVVATANGIAQTDWQPKVWPMRGFSFLSAARR
jgi:Tol biopolymer transport system component